MDREQRPEPGRRVPATQRHLDLAWSSPADPWDPPAPLAAPEGATVPALAWSDPWPPVRSAESAGTDDDPDLETEADAGAADAEPRPRNKPGVKGAQAWTTQVKGAGAQGAGVRGAEPTLSRKSGAAEVQPAGAPAQAAGLDEAEPHEADDEVAVERHAVDETEFDEADPEHAEVGGYYLDSEFDDLAELDELAFPKPGPARSTWFLALAAMVALAFGGGILIQKHHDAGLVRPEAAAAAQLQQAAANAATGGPALTGTIVAVSPTEFTVKDAQGNQHKVAVNDQTPIVKKINAQGLSVGSQVVVQGTSDAAGTLHATAVVEP